MGNSNGKETCGRCSFTSVIDAVSENETGDDSDETETGHRYDPFEGGYIEVDERELRLVSGPAILAGRVKQWLDDTTYRFIHRQ